MNCSHSSWDSRVVKVMLLTTTKSLSRIRYPDATENLDLKPGFLRFFGTYKKQPDMIKTPMIKAVNIRIGRGKLKAESSGIQVKAYMTSPIPMILKSAKMM